MRSRRTNVANRSRYRFWPEQQYARPASWQPSSPLGRSPDGIFVDVVSGASFPLPDPVDLKKAALAAAESFAGEDSDVVAMIRDCDFDYEIVPGKDSLEKLIAVVVTASAKVAAVLRDETHEIQPDFWGAVMEACPDVGDSRIVERTGA